MSLLDRRSHTLSLLEIREHDTERAIFPDGLYGSCYVCAAPLPEGVDICERCDERLTTQAKADGVVDEKCIGCGTPAASGLCRACDPWTEKAETR